MTTHIVYLTSLIQDDTFSSCFCAMGSHGASGIEDDGF